jgi:hypothetical protein
MSSTIDRVRDELIKAKILRPITQRLRVRNMAEASGRGRLPESEPEKPLPDVPLHKRGFGVMGKDVP